MSVFLSKRYASSSDGCRIAYRLAGTAGSPRIVLIHSLAMSGLMWERVAAKIQGVAEILCIDCRGHGESGTGTQAFRPDLMADDILAVMDDIGWPSAVIAGCSMGGCIAQAFAARHTRQTDALCLIDTTAWYGPSAISDWQERIDRARKDGILALAGFQKARWFSDDFTNNELQLVSQAVSWFSKTEFGGYEQACQMLGAVDLRDTIRGFPNRTVIMVGADDTATPLSMAQELHALIPGSQLLVIDKCRHLSPIERPDAIAQTLQELAVI
jgi:3-oxoadipate enol-lactonase